MKNILIISTVSRQFTLFERVNIEILRNLGYTIHGAASFDDRTPAMDALNIVEHEISLTRFPVSFANIRAFFQLVKIIKKNNITAVHCHSPSGGLVGRLAASFAGVKSICYTAHGFHFFKGAPLFNWLIFYPVELLLSFFTSKLFVINKEDYEVAHSRFHSKETIYVPGIGVDLKKFDFSNKNSIRNELGLSKDTVIVTSIGEFIERKNYKVTIESFSRMNCKNSVLVICGIGKLKESMVEFAAVLGVKDRVHFLGYRKDIVDILAGSDVFLFPSRQEGLPVSVMEAMASGLPIVCSAIRGNTDLIEHEVNGFLCSPDDIVGITTYLDRLASSSELRVMLGRKNIDVMKSFSSDAVESVMLKHYMTL